MGIIQVYFVFKNSFKISNFSINMDTLFDVIPLYAKLTDLKTGLTNMQAFSRYMQIKPNESLNDIFYLFDQVNVN